MSVNAEALAVPRTADVSQETGVPASRRIGYVERTAEALVIVALVGELAIMFANVIARTFWGTSLLWSLELAELALVVITFVGGAIAYPRNEHMALHVVVQRLPARWLPTIEALVCLHVLVMAVVGCWLAYDMILSRWGEQTPYLGLDAAWFGGLMMLGLALLGYFAVCRLLRQPARPILTATFILAGVAAIVFGLAYAMDAVARDYALSFAFCMFALQLALGVPIGFVLLMVTMLYLDISKMIPLSVVPINMQSGISSFVMLSIPFFILAGYIMTEGGLSRRLTDFVIALVGRFRGGLLQVIVVSMYVMSGISGSKIADVAAVGTTMKSVMKREGYDAGETAAVLASCAVMGETVPPSIAMLVLASVTSLSIGTLFIAGLLPAAVMALCLMVLIYVKSRHHAGGLRPQSLKEVGRAALASIPAVGAPVILIGGIVSGVATPTEVSSTAVVYSLALSILVYRSLSLGKLWSVLSSTAAQAGMVLFITSTASTFSWSLTIAKLPQEIAALFSVFHGSATMFMIATLETLTIMGALLEGLPALLIFAPLLLPMVSSFGIDPLQYGIVMIIAMGLGAFAPPIGVGLFVTCSICETTMENAARHMWPYLIVLVMGLMLIAFVPWFTLILPRMLGAV